MKKQSVKIIDSGAVIADANTHRYSLWRTWDYDKPRIMFIGLNPSRADATYNDATITRCINFAHGWDYGSMYFANLYSFRTPYVRPQEIKPDVEEQWPPLIENLHQAYNDETNMSLQDMIVKSQHVVCCWGSWKFDGFERRVKQVLQMIQDPYCFGVNADGQPKHPLYLKSSSTLQKLTV